MIIVNFFREGPRTSGNYGPLDWADLLFKAPFNMSEWPEIGPLPHVGKIRCPPSVALLPRDKRGYPVLASLKQDKPGWNGPLNVDFTAIDHLRVKALVEENACGICGLTLFKGGMDIVKPERCYFIGGPVSCERTATFNDPPMHFACAVFALRVCPWMILARYRRTEIKGHYETAIVLDERPIKLGLLQATSYEFDPRDWLYTARFPHLLGYVAPQGWPTDEAMKAYWTQASNAAGQFYVSDFLKALNTGLLLRAKMRAAQESAQPTLARTGE